MDSKKEKEIWQAGPDTAQIKNSRSITLHYQGKTARKAKVKVC